MSDDPEADWWHIVEECGMLRKEGNDNYHDRAILWAAKELAWYQRQDAKQRAIRDALDHEEHSAANAEAKTRA